MIYIIEGPDGTGKSTLAKLLAEQTHLEIVHMEQPKTEEEKRHMFLDYQSMIRHKKSFILDRAWYSELVYGPVMRKKSELSIYDMYSLESVVAKHGGTIIYCTDDPRRSFARAHKRGEEFINQYEQHYDICRSFDQLMSIPHKIPVLTYRIPD